MQGRLGARVEILLVDDELQGRILTVPLNEFVPDTGVFYLSKAFLLRARGDMSTARAMADSAAAVYQARVRKVPDAAFSHSSLGIAYAIAGRREPALEHGLRAMELLPISADYLHGAQRIVDLAQIHLFLGETDVARCRCFGGCSIRISLGPSGKHCCGTIRSTLHIEKTRRFGRCTSSEEGVTRRVQKEDST